MSNRIGGKRHLCQCGHPRVYSYAFDAFYCPDCDVWIDPNCLDEPNHSGSCIFCLSRADKPSRNKLCKEKIL